MHMTGIDNSSTAAPRKNLAEKLIAGIIAGIKKILPQSFKQTIRRLLVTEPVVPTVDSALMERVTDLEVQIRQLTTILQREHNFLPPPPKHLQVRVVSAYVPEFIESGYSSVYPDLNRSLEKAGKKLENFHRILDFGCGCGRALRALSRLLPDSELFGTDIDEEAIQWLNIYHPTLGKFFVAPHTPPMPVDDHMFDLVFGISVFTHLPEDMQFQWLEELRRITKPAGYAILTTHGEKHYRKFDLAYLEIMEKKGFFYSDFGSNYGKSISLPDFYQGTYHSHAYIRREWNKYFDVIDITALGMQNHQDVTLLQRRSE